MLMLTTTRDNYNMVIDIVIETDIRNKKYFMFEFGGQKRGGTILANTEIVSDDDMDSTTIY